ncbi:translation initiation factor IF-2-like [Harpia harpyja]|uniref:translation initiation factor IF-2-like n=1 Tax=Harpia harpyja TaxID=202280 RepID=UPI0022B0D2D5|nr:translation initiation factor IF-2-like [Harpia harpyja]
MRCIASREIELDAALRKGGGIVPRAASTAALPAETVVVATPGPQRGAKAGPRGGTTMATDGLSTPGATTPREAGGGSGEGLGMLLGMMAELQVQNGTSCPPQGAASAASGQAGIPPGNGAQQGADPSAGPAAPGAKLGGSAHGPTAADSDGGAGIPRMAELRGRNGMSQPSRGGADPGAGPAALGAEHSGSGKGGRIGTRAEL